MSPTQAHPPRRLKDDEVARVVSAARRLGYPIGTLVEMMVLTGAPPRATRFMRWADIDNRGHNKATGLWKNRSRWLPTR
jgi:integrase